MKIVELLLSEAAVPTSSSCTGAPTSSDIPAAAPTSFS